MSSLPTVKAANLGGKAATVNKTRELGDQAKWVQVQALDWTDEDGKDRVWEVASRKTTGKGGIDGEPGINFLLQCEANDLIYDPSNSRGYRRHPQAPKSTLVYPYHPAIPTASQEHLRRAARRSHRRR